MGGAIEALRADREALLEIGEGLSDDQWGSPSGSRCSRSAPG